MAMINLISVFNRGGMLLWTRELQPPKGSPINNLIEDVLIEDHRGENSMQVDSSYTMKWTLANKFNLVFVAVYLNLSRLLYVDELLEKVKARFCDKFAKLLVPGVAYIIQPVFDFEADFKSIEASFHKPTSSLSISGVSQQRSFFDKPTGSKKDHSSGGRKTKKQKALEKKVRAGILPESALKENSNGNQYNRRNNRKNGHRATGGDTDEGEQTASDASDSGGDASTSDDGSDDTAKTGAAMNGNGKVGGVNPAALAKLRKKGIGAKGRGGPKKKKAAGFWGDDESIDKKSPAKKMATKWPGQPLSKKEQEKLDMSSAEDRAALMQKRKEHEETVGNREYGEVNLAPEIPEEDEEEEDEEDTSSSSSGGLLGLFSRVVAGKELTAEDLAPVIADLKESLVGKNVALEISEQVCDSVAAELEGTKMSNFSRTKTVVKQSLEQSLLRIVTPRRKIDLLHGVAKARAERRPYSIVFIGVNGVGKSTSLAKVSHYLGTRNLKVSMCACDTFRSGAVEQLLTHAMKLGVRVYEQGYSKDPAAVAAAGIKEARLRGDDVVLIDTAGRMQDNEPLMRALSKLVVQNQPDLVLFVGEALVGNDAVDQLTKFNRALSDLSTEKMPRLIDGIVLTKFDTVDDKVGAAISMTYTTGAPIVFIGTGQTYDDLKLVHPTTLIRKLLR